MTEPLNAPVPECRDTDDCCPGGPDACRLDAARKAQQSQPRTGIACAALHTDRQGNTIPCPGYPNADAVEPEPDDYDEDTRPEAPSRKEANPALPVQPDPRQPAYDAVYEYIRNLGAYLPPDPVHRNAIIWRAVSAALDATPVGRCVSSHCVEGDHILPLGEWETP